LKNQNTLLALLLAAFSIGAAQGAGSPMHEDFTALLAISQKAVDAGKAGDAAAFTADAEEAFKLAKEQSTTASSPAIQRIASKLRAARDDARTGKIAEGTAAIEEAMAAMKEPPKAQKFGGGS
jgi:hypothetical protein